MSRACRGAAAAYGVVLLAAGNAWLLLQRAIIRRDGPDSPLARAIGGDLKGRLSSIGYAAAVGLAFVHSWIAAAIYVAIGRRTNRRDVGYGAETKVGTLGAQRLQRATLRQILVMDGREHVG